MDQQDNVVRSGKAIIENEVLPFNSVYQEAVLGHLLITPLFFLKCRRHIKPYWFQEAKIGFLYSQLVDFYEKFSRNPTTEELKGTFASHESREIYEYTMSLDRCLHARKQVKLDVIKMELETWMLAVGFKEALVFSQNTYNRERNVRNAFVSARSKLNDLNKILFHDLQSIDFKNTKEWFANDDLGAATACTTGLEIFDRAILPAKPGYGSLLPGETTVFLAPVTTGKTTTLISIIKHNILKGKSVLWLTHEDHPDNLKKKLFLCFMKTPETQILPLYNDPEGIRKIEATEEIISRRLVYRPFNKAGRMYIEDVIDVIRLEQEERKIKYGKGFDLIVDDYPARLTVRTGVQDPIRTKIGRIYDSFVQIAIEENLHCVLAIQGNRDSSKVNRDGKRLVNVEDSSESFDVPMFVSNVITINRSLEDRKNNRTVFFIDKVRKGPGKIAISCASRYDYFTAYSQELGGHIVDGPSSSPSSNEKSKSALNGININGTLNPDNPHDIKYTNYTELEASMTADKNDTPADIIAKRAAQEKKWDSDKIAKSQDNSDNKDGATS